MALLNIQDIAPKFSVINQDGVLITLDQFKGKHVLLWWYPKADTPGWTIEGKGFRDRISEFNKKNITILGVSCDTPEDNRSFKDKFQFPFDLLCDTSKTMGMDYGVITSSDEVFPKRISYLIGPDGHIQVVYPTPDPATHAQHILADLG